MYPIITERLTLRKPDLSDFANWHRLLSDRKNMYYLQDIQTKSEDESMKNLTFAIKEASKKDRKHSFFAIETNSDRTFIGSIGYSEISSSPLGKSVHIGYFLLPEHHGKGYASESLEGVIRFAFLKGNVFRIKTGCLAENLASERVMLKCGMIKEAHLKQSEWHDGKYKDRVLYRMLRSEFMEMTSKIH